MASASAKRWLWAAVAAWLAAMGAMMALFTFVGESAWPVVILLYLPRLPWILPGLLLLPFALRRGRRALLVPLAAGALLWLFPLMGFVLPPLAPPAPGPVLRVLSYNITRGTDTAAALRALILDARADLVLLQGTGHVAEEAMRGPDFSGWTVNRAFQFTIASRYRVVSLEGVGVPSGNGPPCAHAVLETPLGILDVYVIRPKSAREEVAALRHRGLRQRLREFVQDVRSGRLAELAAFREAQARSIALELARARHPVLIAGDTNLPDGSLFLRRYFGGYSDAFAGTGWGFGYTHPARFPFMRIDRVLLGQGLDAASFQVLPPQRSAHRPVLAEIAASPR